MAIRRAAEKLNAPIFPFPWPVVHAMAPSNENAREMREMIYLWRRSLRLHDARLQRFPGQVPATPLDQALRTALQGLGRL